MPVVGTAGHVDHGKSTLIEAMTGRDPDRWDEEKRRGLTIDLGFAWTTLPDGTEVSFVDVPGHERYLKNMLAGIEHVDVALFVVAADEGWMPQSEEHLAVLDLLGVRRGVVALTKSDKVDEELIDIALSEVSEKLFGTTLEGSPIIPVSALRGRGVDRLLIALNELVPGPLDVGERPRLWVDRSFSIEGAGTVVTGTLLDGPLQVGQTVNLLPQGIEARVRTLQSHESQTETAVPGRRVAINLGGVDRNAAIRGSMVGLPGQWDLTSRFSASLVAARYTGEMTEKGAYQLHIGSGAYPATIERILDGYTVIRSTTALPLETGDRFILRDTGRRLVVAGGRVLDPAPGKLTPALSAAHTIDLTTPDTVATTLLEIRGVDALPRLSAHSGGGKPTAGTVVGEIAVSDEAARGLEARVMQIVEREHAERPLRSGIPLASLATGLGQPAEVIGYLVERAQGLERTGAVVHVTGYTPEMTPEEHRSWVDARETLSRSLAVPKWNELGLEPEVVHLLTRQGELLRISEDFVMLPAQAEALKTIIQAMDDQFTVADFRDAAGVSRKHAVPFLEWADRENLTIRSGDRRDVRR